MNRRLNFLLLLLLCGCRTPQMPAIDLDAPGWNVRTGQAIWERGGAPRMAVDILFADNDETAWLQLSKGGLPMATVTLTARAWELDGSMFGRKARGRGRPPVQAGVAQLAIVLRGGEVSGRWRVEKTSELMALIGDREKWKVYLDE